MIYASLDPGAERIGLDGQTTKVTSGSEIEQIIRTFRDAFSDIEFTVEDAIERENAVAVRWRGTMRHTGTFFGIGATNKTVSMTGMAFIETDGVHVQRTWNNWDLFGLLQQIGLDVPSEE